jgi:5-methyltetrahydrofolate--homocysteine methyltransferase
MQRLGMDLPLLIGGATTSRTHTAVKIAPAYKGPTLYASDASRAVPMVQKLLSEEAGALIAETKADQETARAQYLNSQDKRPRLPIAKARERAPKLEIAPAKPSFLGLKEFNNFPLADLVDYIDWTPFFASWELVGRYPAILEDDIVGEAATNLYKDARAMLKQLVEEKWVTANGVIGFWPANADGDDIIVWADEARTKERARLYTLRQQMDKSQKSGAAKPNFALSDFIAGEGVQDYIGGFAVTAGIGEEEIARRFKLANDDYSAILAQALCDRLAEAFAEAMHAKVRRELWGYASDETLTPEELIAEKYRGIRPAPGYPAQPDHTEKATLFDLLEAEARTGMVLTESYAMAPPSSVSGLYFAHPQSEYFGVGRIDRDQVEDYARRKGWELAYAERWLAPILAYDPVRADAA